MNKLEKIFNLIINFGDSEKRIPEMGKLLQSLHARLQNILTVIREIGEATGIKEAASALKVYDTTVKAAEKSKKKYVETTAEENTRNREAEKYIENLRSKYGNLIFTKREVATLSKNYAVLQRAEKGSIEEITAKVNILRVAWNKMGVEQRNSTAGKQVTADLKRMREEIRLTTMAAGDNSRNIGNYAGSIKKLFSAVGTAWATARAVFNTFRSSIKTISDFEQANANLATVLGKSASDIKDLTKSALELGRTTEYTASQVTQLQTELAKLGFGEAAIQSMQKPVLQFATAVGANLADAAALAGATLRAFDLEAKDTEEMLSVLAVATNKSALSFSYLQTSMAIVSPVARMFGFNVKDTAALLGTLANSGFDASMAATATRNILLHLADANGKLAKALGQPVRTLPELVAGLQKLRDGGVDLATTLELTDKRSVAAFNTFLNGAEGLKTLRGELENTNGELKRIQEERLNTVEGSVKLLTSAWEGLVLSFSNSKGAFKKVIDLITDAINGVNILLNPDSQISTMKNEFADRLLKTYQTKGGSAYQQKMATGSDYWSSKLIAARDKQNQSGGLLGAEDYRVAKTMWEAFKLAVVETNGRIKQSAVEESLRKVKEAENEKARIAAEKAASTKAAQESAKEAAKVAEKKNKIEQDYTSARRAQEDKIAQYDLEHREAEVQRMDDCLDKKIKLSDIATDKSLTAAKREYDGEVAKLDKELAANKGNQSKIDEIEAGKTALKTKYEQKTTDITAAEADARVKILRDATTEELTEWGKLPDKAAETERQITENKKAEVEKRKKLTQESLADAGTKFDRNERIADKTYGTDIKNKQRHAARLQNEIELRNAQAQTYMAELAWMEENGQTETAAYAQTIANLGRIDKEIRNIANGLNADGSGGGVVGWVSRLFGITPELAREVVDRAFDLASQIGNVMIQAQQQASQRRLKNEKKTIDDQYKYEVKKLDDKRDKGLISEKTYQKEMEKLEAEKAKKEEEAERAAFEREKKLKIAQVWIDIALGIAKAWALFGSNPLTIPVAIVQTAFLTAQGVVQTGFIASQKYAQGGIIPIGDGMGVVKGRSHAQGGHQIYIDGRPIGEIEGDELIAIVNKHDTARIGALSAANSVHGKRFASGGLMFPNGFMVDHVRPPVSLSQIEAKVRVAQIRQQEARQAEVLNALREDTRQQIEAINQRIDTLKVVVIESEITNAQNSIKKIKVRSTW